MNFYESFVKLCEIRGVAPSAIAGAAGLDKSVVSYWKKHPNAKIKLETFEAIAKAFKVDVNTLFETIDSLEKNNLEGGDAVAGTGITEDAISLEVERAYFLKLNDHLAYLTNAEKDLFFRLSLAQAEEMANYSKEQNKTSPEAPQEIPEKE